jgi:hypothetical protein
MASTGRKAEHDKNLGSLHFDPEVENRTVSAVTLYHSNLLQGFDQVVGTKPDPILRIWVYESPLGSWQISAKFLFHSFIVIETERWFYSIETSEKNISMERSKQKQLLIEKCKGEKRSTTLFSNGPKCARNSRGKKTIRDVLVYLHDRDRLNLPYNVMVENCKDLSKWIFDEFNDERQTYSLFFTSY